MPRLPRQDGQANTIETRTPEELPHPFVMPHILEAYTRGAVAVQSRITPLAAIAEVQPSAVMRSSQHGPVLEVRHLSWLNYALVHSGISPIRHLEVRNDSFSRLTSPVVEIRVLPEEYGNAWRCSLTPLRAHDAWQLQEPCRLPISVSRLRQVIETERAVLQAQLYNGSTLISAVTSPLDIQPYNHFLLDMEDFRFLAAFVTPNQPALADVIATAANRLQQNTGSSSFNGYQSKDPKRTIEMVKALHETLRLDRQLQYINPPASFGSGQKIRTVTETLRTSRGTCLDLSVLLASLIEQIGLHPIIIVIPGHAFVGFWTREVCLQDHPAPRVPQQAAFANLLSSGDIVVFNSTTLCHELGNFAAALSEGVRLVANSLTGSALTASDNGVFLTTVDIKACRQAGVTPLP